MIWQIFFLLLGIASFAVSDYTDDFKSIFIKLCSANKQGFYGYLCSLADGGASVTPDDPMYLISKVRISGSTSMIVGLFVL